MEMIPTFFCLPSLCQSLPRAHTEFPLGMFHSMLNDIVISFFLLPAMPTVLPLFDLWTILHLIISFKREPTPEEKGEMGRWGVGDEKLFLQLPRGDGEGLLKRSFPPPNAMSKEVF